VLMLCSSHPQQDWNKPGELSRYIDRLRAGWLRFDSRKEQTIFSLFHIVQTGSGAQPPFREAKRPGRKADHSSICNAEVKNSGATNFNFHFYGRIGNGGRRWYMSSTCFQRAFLLKKLFDISDVATV
jgi:hypothetical protein